MSKITVGLCRTGPSKSSLSMTSNTTWELAFSADNLKIAKLNFFLDFAVCIQKCKQC